MMEQLDFETSNFSFNSMNIVNKYSMASRGFGAVGSACA